jgi:hypothetical protein
MVLLDHIGIRVTDMERSIAAWRRLCEQARGEN